jgi:Tfp pilus assembly protein PilV
MPLKEYDGMILRGTETKRCSSDDRERTRRFSPALFKRRSGNCGFTLIEIMIAVFFLATALVGIMSTTAMIIKTNSLSKTMTTATTLAKDRMEVLKNTKYANLAAGSDTIVPHTMPYMTTIPYTRTWSLQQVAPAIPLTDMQKITVNVAWTWQGVSHTVNVDSIVASE